MPALPFLIGAGAGIASALLYAAAASGSPFALLLLYIAPLPVLLAAVGWRHTAGLVATVVGAAFLALLIGPKTGLLFVLAVGLPSWWLAYLTLLAKVAPDGATQEWYPVGRLMIWCAVLGALLVAATIPLVATDLDAYHAALRTMFEQALQAPGAPEAPAGQDQKALIELMTKLAPGMAASVWTLTSLFNLWLAARITRSSGRLARPWPFLPGVELPRAASLGLLAATALSFLPGLFGLVAGLLAGTMLIAFALLGLTVIHTFARRAAMRGLVLFGFYAVLLILPGLMIPLALLGLADHFFGLKRRFGPPPSPPPTATAPLP